MREQRGFWLSVGATSLALFAGAALSSVWSSEAGVGGSPWLLTASVVPVFVLIVLVIAVASSVGAGWAARSRALRRTASWVVVAPIMKSQTVTREVARLDSARAGRTIARGLTLTANREGIGVWSGRSSPVKELWLPWGIIEDIQPTVTRDRLESHRGIEILVRRGAERSLLPFPVTGGFPFGSRIASPRAIEELVRDLHHARQAERATGVP